MRRRARIEGESQHEDHRIASGPFGNLWRDRRTWRRSGRGPEPRRAIILPCIAEPDREQRVLDGARKEGMVTVYSSMIVDQALRPLIDGFEAKYPFVKRKVCAR